MTPNRLEAPLATGMTIAPARGRPGGRPAAGRALDLESVLVTLDRDGMALVRGDGRRGTGADAAAAGLRHHRRRRHGPGGGRALPGRRGRLRRGGRLGNVAGGLEVEKIGVALLSREEILARPDRPPPPEAGKRLDRARAGRRGPPPCAQAGQTVVFTNGCFDLLHVGHVRLLRQAAALGDFLVVGLNSDASVRRLKGPSRPLNPEDARAELLAGLECVDAVTVFDEDTPLELIEAILPDVLVKGGDYRPEEVVGRDEVEAAAAGSC